MVTSNNLCQNSHNLHAARIENLISGEKKKSRKENNKWDVFAHWKCLYLLHLPPVRRIKDNCYNFPWLEVTELPVLISALASQRTLPKSRRESIGDWHGLSPYSVVDGNLSLGSLAKAISNKLKALGCSEHHCTLWVPSKDLSLDLFCQL